MIINIRGTSGSGKSTLARKVMALYGNRVAYKREGRKQPIGYLYRRPPNSPHQVSAGRGLAVIGHYETPCGGCDTIQKMDDIFQLVRDADAQGHDVLFEGLLISADMKRTLALHEEGLDLKVIALDVDIDTCIASVNERRWAKSPDKPGVNPKNTISKHKGVKSSMKKLGEAGVPATFCNRDEALLLIRELLHV